MAREAPFKASVIRAIAERVAFRCSFPGCNHITIGPGAASDMSVSRAGEASHIVAASPKGPRGTDPLPVADRRKAGNGIWMCRTHGRLIDSNASNYTAAELRAWKQLAESRAAGELGGWWRPDDSAVIVRWAREVNSRRVFFDTQEDPGAATSSLSEVRHATLVAKSSVDTAAAQLALNGLTAATRGFLDRWDPYVRGGHTVDMTLFMNELAVVRHAFAAEFMNMKVYIPMMPTFGFNNR